MAGPKDVTIRAQALDGTWQTMGGETARGLYPENVSLEADAWGSSGASFNLRRDPRAFFPDIGAFTPVEIDVGSTLVWSGRVRETPSQVAQRTINVQCEGWQFHLDDDIYDRYYVRTALGDFKDQRTFLSATLSVFPAAAIAQAGDGVVLLGWPNGAVVTTGQRAAVVLDLGPGQYAASVAIDFDGLTTDSNNRLFALLADGADGGGLAPGQFDISASFNNVAGTSSQVGVTATTTSRRYVHIYCQQFTSGTFGADTQFRITGIRVASATSYLASGTSVLRASDVVSDALGRSTALLSSDRSGITPTTFNIPSYAPGWQTARQAWTAVDAYHDWLKQIDVNKRPVYTAKPTRPLFEVGAHSAIDDDDASANSGAEIYNRTVVSSQTPDGAALALMRATAPTTTDIQPIASGPSLTNPSADTNTVGWTVGDNSSFTTAALARDTSAFDSTPASFKMTGSLGANNQIDTTQWTRATLNAGYTFKAGKNYVLALAMYVTVHTTAAGPPAAGSIFFGAPVDWSALTSGQYTTVGNDGYVNPAYVTPGDRARLDLNPLFPTPSLTPVWTPVVLQWIPVADTPSASVEFTWVSGRNPLNPNGVGFDSIGIYESTATVVDRRRFARTMQLPINSTLPSDGVAAGKIGDVWLADHKTTPFRGSITLVGDESLREITTGRDVGLEQLLLNTGQLIRFSDRSDPDTGGHGRDGRIAAVTYSPAANTAAITVDNSRTSFDALLSRLAVIQGG